jgi:uncharacterized protein YheU (UPF0270 family)
MSDWDDEREPPPPPIAVPHGELSPEALRGLVEAFVLREGTDYGERDVPFEDKIGQVMRQLERGEAQVLFEPADSSVTIALTDRGQRGRGR